MAKIRGITIELGADASGVTKALKGIDSQLKTTQNNLKDIDRLLKFKPGNTDLLIQKQKNLESSISLTKKRIEELKKTQGNLEKGSEAWNAVQREVVANEEKLKGLQKQYKQFGSVASQQIKAVGQSFQEVGDKVSKVGSTLTKKVTVPLVAAATAAVVPATTFEDSMAKVSTIADTSAVSIEELSESILSLSDESGVAASDIAENVYNAISAGQDTADAVNFVSNATKLARAGFTETGSALDILTTVMNAYGLEAEDVTRVSDVLINTQNLGKTTVNELASSMGKIIPTAKANGIELETLAGAYAVMTSNGIATAETTTYLNSMLNELGKQGSAAQKAFAEGTRDIKEGGLSIQEAAESGMSLTEILSILDKEAEKSGTTIANMFGSAEAGKAATVLLGNAEKLDSAITSMGESSGATDSAYEKLNTTSQTMTVTLNQLKNIVISMGQTVLQMVAPLLRTISEKMKKIKERFDQLSPQTKEMIVKVGAIVAAIGPAVFVIGKIITGVGAVISVLGTVVGVLGGPLTLAIAAVIAIGVLLYKNWDTIKEKAEELKQKVSTAWENLKTKVSTVIETIKGKIETFKQKIETLKSKFESLKSKVSEVWESIKTKLQSAITLPHIPLPHFTVEPPGWKIGDLLQGTIPSLSIKWYKKAYDNPMMFTSPTVMATPNGMKGFGDGHGAEIVLGLDKLRELVGSQNQNVNVTVVLEGDARNIFKVVKNTNTVRTRATNYNALAVGG